MLKNLFQPCSCLIHVDKCLIHEDIHFIRDDICFIHSYVFLYILMYFYTSWYMLDTCWCMFYTCSYMFYIFWFMFYTWWYMLDTCLTHIHVVYMLECFIPVWHIFMFDSYSTIHIKQVWYMFIRFDSFSVMFWFIYLFKVHYRRCQFYFESCLDRSRKMSPKKSRNQIWFQTNPFLKNNLS